MICTAVILISFICLGAVLLLISSNYFNSEKTQKLERSVLNFSYSLSSTMKDAPADWKSVAQIKINEYSKNTGSNMLIVGSDGKTVLSSDLLEEYSPLKNMILR